MKSVYRHDLTMLAVINLWAQLLFSDRESTVESGDAHTHTGSDFFRRKAISNKLRDLSGGNR